MVKDSRGISQCKVAGKQAGLGGSDDLRPVQSQRSDKRISSSQCLDR